MNQSIDVLGCRLDAVNAVEAVERIVEFAKAKTRAQVVTLGTEMVVAAQRDVAFRQVINASTLNVCDTVGLLAVARSRGVQLHERVTGVELVEALAARAHDAQLGLFLLGAAPGVAQEAADALAHRYPGLILAGVADGYFSVDDEPELLERIRSSGASLLFLGLGSPRQEFWFASHTEALPGIVGIGVGGSFDVLSGRVARAPQAWRALHLEWLYRLLKEPSRWRRQLALPTFVGLVLLEKLRGPLPRREV